jgi:cytochrome P450
MALQATAPSRQQLPEDFDPLLTDEPYKIYEEYDKLRVTCPVSHTERYGGYWQLTRYEDIKAAAIDNVTFISSVTAVVPSDPRGTRRPPLNFDAPTHTPYRTALDRTLKVSRIKRLRGPLTVHAENELRPMLENGGGDVSGEFGARFPAWVETEWLNLELDTAPLLAETAAAWVNAWRAQEKERVGYFSDKMYETAKHLLANRREVLRDPEEDPASSLLLERDSNGEPLDEVHLMCVWQNSARGSNV